MSATAAAYPSRPHSREAETDTGHATPQPSVVEHLKSEEQAELLDAIDKVRRENITATLSVPQIVVCGDQSSGKSSVLEAIAGIQFPRGSGMTTRFPIEVVLRNADTVADHPSIRLHPSPERTVSQQERIHEFKPKEDASSLSHFEEVVRQAKDHLAAVEPADDFWGDRLIIEISGPKQPHLTLVDLPGLIQNAGSNGKVDDPNRIRRMTEQYLNDPHTIVLAVVNASNDQANQQILSLVKHSGNAHSRTMGIITKPDLVPKQSDEEARVIAMANNSEVHLSLGWHVLKNVGQHEGAEARRRRDEIESEFFSSGAWSKLDTDRVGISNLRQSLSQKLLLRVREDLPRLTKEMEADLDRCTKSLERVGEGRESLAQQQGYLSKILSRLNSLVEAGLDGRYLQGKTDFFDGSEPKQLRDIMNGESKAFANALRSRGKTWTLGIPGKYSAAYIPSFNLHGGDGSPDSPQVVSLEKYCKALSRHMRGRQGTHLQIHAAPVVPDIFRQQSIFWKAITQDYVRECHRRALEFMEAAVFHVAGEHTGKKLMQFYVEPAFERKEVLLSEKVSDLLWPYLHSHPITYNPVFDRRTTKANGDRFSERIREETDDVDTNPDLIIAAQAMDQAETYYEIARNVFVDNVATLAVERWLLSDLPSLLTAEDVWKMTPEDIEKIASEHPDARIKRERLTRQVAALKEAIRVCRRHGRQRLTNALDPAVHGTNRASTTSPRATNGVATNGGQKPAPAVQREPILNFGQHLFDSGVPKSNPFPFGGTAGSTAPSSFSGTGSMNKTTSLFGTLSTSDADRSPRVFSAGSGSATGRLSPNLYSSPNSRPTTPRANH